MKKLLLSIFIVSSLSQLFAEDSTPTAGTEVEKKEYKSVDDVLEVNKTKLEAPLLNIFSSTDWEMFLQEFEIKAKIGFCKHSGTTNMGFYAHMIEPIGYMETVKKPLEFPFAEFELGGNILKSCSSRDSSVESSTRDECYNQHFIYAPIMGMIFKKKLKFTCFHSGTVALPLLSEFVPSHTVDVYAYKMIPHMIAMFSPQALVSSVINCAATTAYSAITGYSKGVRGDTIYGEGEGGTEIFENNSFGQDEWAEGYEEPDIKNTRYTEYNSLKEKGINSLAFIRNSMFYNIGCIGFSPVGGYVRGLDPGVDSVMLSYGTTALLHGFGAVTNIPLLQKQTEFGMEMSTGTGTSLPGSTMCKPKNFAMPIETQYVYQRAFPTVSGGKETGESGVATTTLANTPGSKDSFVNVFWERRDYFAFAYFCSDKKPSEL